MAVTVDLDNQHLEQAAGEIGDVAADHDLTAELGTGEAPRPERKPQLVLEWAWLAAHLFGSFE
jgi:hypothetical protein